MACALLIRSYGICPFFKQRLLRSAGTCAQISRRLVRRPTQIRAERQQRGGALGDENVDVAVFRFTLGIPGFEDRLIPRVVGCVVGALLIFNHVLGAQPTPDAQLRSEWLGALLAAMCFFVPDVEERLREAMPGRGRQKTAESIDGATNCFFLDPSLPDASKKELAWSSFSLLKNTNCCGVLVAAGNRVVMARGAVGSRVVTPGDAITTLTAMSADLAAATSSSGAAGAGGLREVASGTTQQLWLPERSQFGTASGAAALAAVPAGAQCLLAQHIKGTQPGVLLVYSERPRALAERERGWVAAVADKLSAFV